MIVKHTAYENGIIRDADGKLFARFDKDTHILDFADGSASHYQVQDIEHAMEIIANK